jgi:hypothetical protein
VEGAGEQLDGGAMSGQAGGSAMQTMMAWSKGLAVAPGEPAQLGDRLVVVEGADRQDHRPGR